MQVHGKANSVLDSEVNVLYAELEGTNMNTTDNLPCNSTGDYPEKRN